MNQASTDARQSANPLSPSESSLESTPVQDCTSMVPESIPSLKSFAHVRNPKARRALEYEQHLMFALEKFPEYRERIETELTWARGQRERKPKSDRDRVLKALETQALTAREVAEDLSIPYSTAYKILTEHLENGMVAAYEHKSRAGNKPYLVFSLPH